MIAGIGPLLHLEHLAKIRYSSANASTLKLTTFKLSRALNLAADDVRVKLDRMLSQHEKEWKDFMGSLGQGSFLRKWASEVPS